MVVDSKRSCCYKKRTALRLQSWYLEEKGTKNRSKTILKSGKMNNLFFAFIYPRKKFWTCWVKYWQHSTNKCVWAFSNNWNIIYRFLQVHKPWAHISSKSCCLIYKAKCPRDIEVNIFFCCFKHTSSHL